MFLTFESEHARDLFLDRIRQEQPALLAKLRSSKLQPTLVARNLIRDEVSWLEKNMDASGKIHRDIQFAPL
jgi:hypothetical protein